jgi:hypothetical protein
VVEIVPVIFQFSLLRISSCTLDGVAATGKKEVGKSKKYEFKEKKEKLCTFDLGSRIVIYNLCLI